jgi:hypothetical protein
VEGRELKVPGPGVSWGVPGIDSFGNSIEPNIFETDK